MAGNGRNDHDVLHRSGEEQIDGNFHIGDGQIVQCRWRKMRRRIRTRSETVSAEEEGYYIGVPCKLGAAGLEQIIEIKLTTEEDAALKKSADAVKELCAVIGV